MVWKFCLRLPQKLDANVTVKRYKALPLIVPWGIWLSRNASLFEDRYLLPLQCAMQSLLIINSFPQLKADKPIRQIDEEITDRSGPGYTLMGQFKGTHCYVEKGVLYMFQILIG